MDERGRGRVGRVVIEGGYEEESENVGAETEEEGGKTLWEREGKEAERSGDDEMCGMRVERWKGGMEEERGEEEKEDDKGGEEESGEDGGGDEETEGGDRRRCIRDCFARVGILAAS